MRFVRLLRRRRKTILGSTRVTYQEQAAVKASLQESAAGQHEQEKAPEKALNQPGHSVPSIEQVPLLVQQLNAVLDAHQSTESEKAARILRQLVIVSEDHAVRGQMIANGALLNVIFNFVDLCRTEQERRRDSAVCPDELDQQAQLYLALLLVNNLSIPPANKRIIAIKGTPFLSRILTDDPSCHLAAVLLANWTVQDAALRREMVTTFPNLIPSLVVAFSASSLSPDVYRNDFALASPAKRAVLLSNELSTSLDTNNFAFPDAVRWCLTVLQNLTRPTNEPSLAAQQLIHTGIVPSILQCLGTQSADDYYVMRTNSRSNNNHPLTWEAQTSQDAALYVILNLTADPSSRKKLEPVLNVLARLVNACRESKSDVANLQCLKARMAVANVLAPDGLILHRWPAIQIELEMRRSEREVWIVLLANVMYRRSNDGPGGYAATTFSVKQVLSALYCQLKMYPENKAKIVDVRLNTLLLKVVGGFAVQCIPFLSKQVAEYAISILYWQSHFGFQVKCVWCPLSMRSHFHDVTTLLSLTERFAVTFSFQSTREKLPHQKSRCQGATLFQRHGRISVGSARSKPTPDAA